MRTRLLFGAAALVPTVLPVATATAAGRRRHEPGSEPAET